MTMHAPADVSQPMTAYETEVLQELLANIAMGAMITESALCVHSTRVVYELHRRAKCWRRGNTRLYADHRPLESDLPYLDLVVLQRFINQVEEGNVVYPQTLIEIDPQLNLHLPDYVSAWCMVGPDFAGVRYFAERPQHSTCLRSSTATR